MFGNIQRYRTAATGIAHNINNAVHCTFFAQDITAAGGGVVRALPRAFVTAANHGANADVITNSTAAGVITLDTFVTTGHSLFDIGPVCVGATPQTRTAAQVSPWVGAPAAWAGAPQRRPMRSLHKEVVFTITGPATFIDVVITHRLGTANTVAFVSPTLDPCDPGAVGDIVNVWQTATDTVSTTLRMGLASGGAPFGAPVVVNFDVMILARWGSGAHSRMMRQHSATVAGGGAVPTYVDSDDYSLGGTAARQITPAQAQGFRGNPSYGALYTNVDGLVNAGVAIAHNMGSATGAMCLFGHRANILLNKPAILGNATSATTMTLQNAVVAALDNSDIFFVRPYSPVAL